MKFSNAVLALLALFSFVLTPPAFPQSPSSNARLTGSLTDPSGSSVSGARITAQLEGSSTVRTSESSADGSYTLDLPPGHYRIVVAKSSFITKETDVTLQAGESLPLNLRLELAPMSASVVVTGQALPVSEPQTTAPTDIFTRQDIDNRQAVTIPDLIQFAPGVAIGRTGPFGGTASVFLDGGNSSYTKVLVDGTPINPPGGAVDFSNLTTDNIDKVEIVHGAESAMYGTDAVSGVIQLFTHRGATTVPAFSVFA
jgi:outer membrane receptor protein involved in Fe transport